MIWAISQYQDMMQIRIIVMQVLFPHFLRKGFWMIDEILPLSQNCYIEGNTIIIIILGQSKEESYVFHTHWGWYWQHVLKPGLRYFLTIQNRSFLISAQPLWACNLQHIKSSHWLRDCGLKLSAFQKQPSLSFLLFCRKLR